MITIEINDKEEATQLRDKMSGIDSAEVELLERRNLTGADATWILAINVAVHSVEKLLPVLDRFIHDNRVKAIAVDGVRIERPTNEQVDYLIKHREDPTKTG